MVPPSPHTRHACADCAVGDGAETSFKFLYKQLAPDPIPTAGPLTSPGGTAAGGGHVGRGDGSDSNCNININIHDGGGGAEPLSSPSSMQALSPLLSPMPLGSPTLFDSTPPFPSPSLQLPSQPPPASPGGRGRGSGNISGDSGPRAAQNPNPEAPSPLTPIGNNGGSGGGGGGGAADDDAGVGCPNGKTVRSPTDRSRVLAHLHGALTAHAHALEPRLGPMIKWVGHQTRACFEGVLQHEAVPLALTVSELQVNLCEWRKFLSVDKKRLARRGSVLCV